MSKFFPSYFKKVTKSFKKRFLFSFRREQWQIHIIPLFHLYFDSYSPSFHERFWNDGVNGLYLCIGWLQWSVTMGISRKH